MWVKATINGLEVHVHEGDVIEIAGQDIIINGELEGETDVRRKL